MKKIGGVFAFKVKDGPNGQEATWFVDVKNGNGCVHNDTGKKTQGSGAQYQVLSLACMTMGARGVTDRKTLGITVFSQSQFR